MRPVGVERARRLMAIPVTVLVLGAGFLLLVSVFQRSLIYFPFREVPSPEEMELTGVETVSLSTADGLSLAGWFLATPATAPSGTVIVFNGNAGNRAYRAPLAAGLVDRGYHVLLFDYRGYGGNEGAPSETGLLTDARAARAYLVGRPDVDATRLVYFGESLGSGVAIALAAEHQPAALVLRSPFTSLADVGRFHYPFLPVRLLLKDRFASLDAIGRVASPVLVIAGGGDRIVPVHQSRRLFDAIRGPRTLVIIEGADHNDLALLAGDQMMAAVGRFLSAI